jgi:hypothetical protein
MDGKAVIGNRVVAFMPEFVGFRDEPVLHEGRVTTARDTIDMRDTRSPYPLGLLLSASPAMLHPTRQLLARTRGGWGIMAVEWVARRTTIAPARREYDS